jgi:hypothetical protein
MTSQFGSKIIRHFNDRDRGPNRGKNDHGVDLEVILISTEVENFWDTSVESLRSQNGYDFAAYDAAPNRRSDLRDAWSHYRGVESTPSPGSLPFSQRRRIVLLNTLRGADGLEVREILYNGLPQSSGAISQAQEDALKAAINSVRAGALPDNDGDGDPDESDLDDDNDGLSDEVELTLASDPFLADTDGDGISDALEDPDGDHFTNEQELNLLLTDPLDAGSRFTPVLERGEGGLSIAFPTHPGRRYRVESSTDLVQFEEVSTASGTGELVVVALGPLTLETRFYRVFVEFEP